MPETPLTESASLAALLHEGIWERLEAVVDRAAAWRLLLAGADGRPIERQTPDPPAGGDPEIPPGRIAPLVDPAAFAVYQAALAGGTIALVREAARPTPRLWAVVPIGDAGVSVGALLVGGAEATDVSPEAETRLREAAAHLSGLAGAITSLYMRGADGPAGRRSRDGTQVDRTLALQQLAALVAASHDLQPILRLVLQETRRLFSTDRGAIFLGEPDGTLRAVETAGLSPTYIEAVNRYYRQAAGGRAATTLDIVYVADAQAGEIMGPLRTQATAEGFRTLLVVPFVNRGTAIGALALYHDVRYEYREEDYSALTTLANQVALAIDNARLADEAQRQLSRLTFLVETGRVVSSSLDTDHVLGVVARAAVQITGGACGVFLSRPDDPLLDLRSYHDYAADAEDRRFAYLVRHRPRLGVEPIGLVAQGGEARIVTAGGASEPPDPYLQPLAGHSYLVVPLRTQERTLGALVCWLFDPARQFSLEDMSLAEALAERAAVAIEHTRLYDRERQAQHAKDEFLSSVSHELRTPLTAIMGYAQLVRKRLSTDPAQAHLVQQMETIWRQAERLHRLIETILDISRIEQGQLALQCEHLDIAELLRTVVDRTRAGVRPGVRFDIAIPPELCTVWGDRIRLEQVLSHLLSNAVKFSPLDGVIQLRATRSGGQVQVEVIDQGPGMPGPDTDRVFERYYQSETPLNRAGGLGLGLYVSRAIVEQHGGTIRAESAPGAGASFRVTLRCEPANIMQVGDNTTNVSA